MIELLTTEEMSRADQLTIDSGTPGAQLMENAGDAIVQHILKRFPEAESIRILCGPGNNGGDGFVAARLLKGMGKQVELALLGDVEHLKGDAAIMASRWDGGIKTLGPDSIGACDLLIDAIFGSGLARPIEGQLAETINAANKLDVPIVAVDVPSGIDGTTGERLGTAIEATTTVTFFRCKPGHLLFPGRRHCGEVDCENIGIPDQVLATIHPGIFANAPDLWKNVFPWPQQDGHKYHRGHTVVVSGPAHATGAARLAAKGALRSGSGLVTVASPREALAVNAAQLTAIMVEEFDNAQGLAEILADQRKNAVLIGPGAGIGNATIENVLTILKSNAGVVLDADALTVFADNTESLVSAIKSRNAPVILTPHQGEFDRIFSKMVQNTAKTKKARSAAMLSGAIVILKGADSVIASPDGKVAINATGTPWLATAGTGDVLAGITTGLIAQNMPAFECACAAAWLHGLAGEIIGPGLIAEDLSEMLPSVLGQLSEM